MMSHQFHVNVELSWYDPARCATESWNCFDPAYWFRMAAGHDARKWYGRAVACPEEFPIGTKFIIDTSQTKYGLPTSEWMCLDRGGAVVIKEDGTVVLDLLLTYPIWRDVVDAQVVIPDGPNR